MTTGSTFTIQASKSVVFKTSARGRRRWCPKDRKSTRLNSSHSQISYAVFCLKKKNDERDTGVRVLHRPSKLERGNVYEDAFTPGRLVCPQLFVEKVADGPHRPECHLAVVTRQ